MMWIRLFLFLSLFYTSPVRGQGVVLLPFDALGRSRSEATFFQETLLTQLSCAFRLFDGEGVEAALSFCCGAAPSISSCLALVGEHFEARWGVRGRWEERGDGGIFSLEVVDLQTGVTLFLGRNNDDARSEEARIVSLVRRAWSHVFLETAVTMTVMPGMTFLRLPGEGPVPLYLQIGEVTQAQWWRVMGYNPSWFIACGGDCPVESVTRREIHRFLSRINRLGRGRFRLPTLHEWQRAFVLSEGVDACLEGNNCVSYGGYPCDQWPGRGEACGRCGPRPFSGEESVWVNMTGNVWEWVAVSDTMEGGQGLLVGGGWADSQPVDPWYRVVISPRFAADDVGFRLLLEGVPPSIGDTH